ncbi:uncharacterized protein PG986_010347 [Apiospora aurea]|uniref:Uncharacterized protein n=1 Tax=Apiospora aurea TaxID=335848 RepID=A0ABR1Q215_9PEZI
MHFATASTVVGLLAVAAATPANNLFARHAECTYSAVQGEVQREGTCKVGSGTEAGYCEIPGMEGVYGCDYAWRNNAKMSACGEAKRSKYACQKDGDPCWAFQYMENPTLSIIHCSNK